MALLLTLGVDAQVAVRDMRGLTREQIDSIVHPTVSAQGANVLRCEPTNFDLGTMNEEDAAVSRTFTLYNVSDKAVRIERVRTTCGCTSATFDSTAIAPGKKTQITLTYNPKNRPGTIDVDAFVYIADGAKQPMARLSLYGEVTDNDVWSHLPYTMGTLRVKRKEATMSELPTQGRPSLRILCANSGNKPLRLSAPMLPRYAAFSTEPEVIAPGTEADLVITIDITKLPKQDTSIHLPVLIEGIGGRPSERTLHITIEQ
ncbi:MAG: DUF1573 domain-containing protein [Bacteroidaceae bacterium]|nr:DUF1573 domain-containing protein [Bacteroidaceae bacterium]